MEKQNQIVTTGILLFSFPSPVFWSRPMRFPQRAPAHTVSFAGYRQLALRKLLWKNLINMRSISFRCEKHSPPVFNCFSRLLGKSDIEGLYLKDDMAIAMEYPMHEDSLKHASVFQRIYETCLKGNAENIYLSIIPDRTILQDDDSALTMDYDDFPDDVRCKSADALYRYTAFELTDYCGPIPTGGRKSSMFTNHLADSMVLLSQMISRAGIYKRFSWRLCRARRLRIFFRRTTCL